MTTHSKHRMLKRNAHTGNVQCHLNHQKISPSKQKLRTSPFYESVVAGQVCFPKISGPPLKYTCWPRSHHNHARSPLMFLTLPRSSRLKRRESMGVIAKVPNNVKAPWCQKGSMAGETKWVIEKTLSLRKGKISVEWWLNQAFEQSKHMIVEAIREGP